MIISILIIHASILLLMGREPYCTCGYIKFWHPIANDPQNSQHLTDWYTLSHIIHGFIFFYLLAKLAPKLSLHSRMIIALLIEIGWELLENSNFIIDKYRNSTIALNYYGDSIVNSFMDIVAMLLGFWLASKISAKWIVTLAIFMEIVALYYIKDNLILNVIMLLYPVDAIKSWQSS